MPTCTVSRHGLTLGNGNPHSSPSLRSECRGWSASAVRRNLQFLYQVDERHLEGLQGVALTLTVRDCPQTAADWTRAKHAFLEALRRLGASLVHWVTEWQARGVPHLHMAVFFPFNPPSSSILSHWLRISALWGSRCHGQHVTPIHDVLGWNQYVSKHAARGLRHYQRSSECLPDAWRGASTGRMWGKLGRWPLQPQVKVELPMVAFHRFRRIVRAWRVADARRPIHRGINVRRVLSARGMLRCPVPTLSAVRGVSEWIPESVTDRLLKWLADQGHSLLSV